MAANVDKLDERTSSTNKQPIPSHRLEEIANSICDSTFESVTEYEHSRTESWNSNIINNSLKSLISEVSTPTQPPVYKFAVTCTIIQHVTPSHSQSTPGNDTGGGGSGPTAASIGRRGMHSASGAYWNNERDGMWHWKYTRGEKKGFDVVLSIIWISTI